MILFSHIPAVFMTSLIQTAGHNMAAFTVVLSRLSNVEFIPNRTNDRAVKTYCASVFSVFALFLFSFFSLSLSLFFSVLSIRPEIHLRFDSPLKHSHAGLKFPPSVTDITLHWKRKGENGGERDGEKKQNGTLPGCRRRMRT